MRGKRLVVTVLLAVVAISAVAGFFIRSDRSAGIQGLGRDTVGIVYIDGTIMGGASTSGLLGGSLGSDDVVAYLQQALDDPGVKAVVLRVNSPGGSAAGAQEIATEVAKLKQDGKKVIVSMGDVAASGAYWIASEADLIVADPATMTGSIGVIMEVQNIEALYKKLGIEMNVIKSAPMKDIGSSTRSMTDQERALLQGMVNDIFDQFVTQVADGRKMPRDKVLGLADGRVFTGRQAKAIGLVDEFGNFHDAIDQAVKLAGITGSYRLKEYGVTSPWDWLLGPQGVLKLILGRAVGGNTESPRFLMFQPAPVNLSNVPAQGH
ncbi:MAG: signal peptide peptidase SppA [Bacillota bacterium]